jgi:hypothetical protein
MEKTGESGPIGLRWASVEGAIGEGNEKSERVTVRGRGRKGVMKGGNQQ